VTIVDTSSTREIGDLLPPVLYPITAAMMDAEKQQDGLPVVRSHGMRVAGACLVFSGDRHHGKTHLLVHQATNNYSDRKHI
jgi:hypothetical protein